ncbi:cd7 antigen-like [Rhinichthys klamathensis goyatoka]|uniref:cd7 antigen-like n=1 Tax=Rhinichthys klamathensis goyatoka TaxID=3034132 RepID=UPI0024B59B34|nr:cd7 antigen-like [Rhinichthys klamathensis goyatoka]
MLGLKYAHVVLLFLITPSVNAHGGIVYIHRGRNSSIDISCESTNKEGKPFAFSLKRRLLQSRRVLYLSEGLLPTINKSEDKDRITVRDELYNHTVHLTISNLQGRDIDVYHCEFYYGSLPEDKNIPGKMEFFIYVEDFSREPLPSCDCLSYLSLLYVISGAACLLGVLVFTLATAYCCKRPNGRKPQPVVPVYEEMTGVRPAKRKATSCQTDIAKLEEANSSVATLFSKENLYVN